MGRAVRLLGSALVLIIVVLTAAHWVTTIGDRLESASAQYADSGMRIYLRNVPSEKQSEALTALTRSVSQADGFVVRADSLLDPLDGSSAGVKFGLFGNPQRNPEEATFSYLGTDILNPKNIAQLLRAAPGKTLGLDRVRADEIAPLPGVSGSTKLVAVKLVTLSKRAAQ